MDRRKGDFRLVLRTVTTIFFACAILSVVEAAVDAWLHQPLAEFLVRRFADVMLMAVGAIGGMLAGQRFDA
ncbi:hypothetical protein ABIF94_002463 [Bradyrhizobium ottawaense]|uniref:hypothetical protein n=1 Tax=Bradyrhizobium ottawaense TaxID=931866 RepID=UPI003835C3CF